MIKRPPCTWPGCSQPQACRERCTYHYFLLLRTGRLPRCVDPAPIRDRIGEHLARGRRLVALATMAGVSTYTLRQIRHNRSRRVQADTARRIMAVPLRPTTVGCIRRVQALRRMGWTQEQIAHQAGLGKSRLSLAILYGRFTDPVALALSATYERLSATPGPSELVRLRAIREHCAPPMAWDGIDIDDPAAAPDLGEDTRRSQAGLLAEFEHLTGLGVTPDRAAEQLGVVLETVRNARRRVTAQQHAQAREGRQMQAVEYDGRHFMVEHPAGHDGPVVTDLVDPGDGNDWVGVEVDDLTAAAVIEVAGSRGVGEGRRAA